MRPRVKVPLPEQARISDILFRPFLDLGLRFEVQPLDHLGRTAQDERAFRNHGPTSHKGIGPDDRTRANHRPIKDASPHPHQHFTPDSASMQDGTVPDRDQLPEMAAKVIGQVDHGIILHITARANGDFVDVPAKRRLIPYTRFLTKGHPPDDIGTGCHKSGISNARPDSLEWFDRHAQ